MDYIDGIIGKLTVSSAVK